MSSTDAAVSENGPQDYEQVVRHAPLEAVSDGLAAAFRSERTPPFPEMVSTLFTHSDSVQQADLLTRLLDGIGPGALAGLPGDLAGLLGSGEVTPEHASAISPQQVQELAADAEKQNTSVVEQVSSLYAEHPEVAQSLGGLALSIAIQHILRRE